MDKNEVWETIKTYAKVFLEGVGLFFAYLFHYIGIFLKFIYKKARKLFRKLSRLTKKHIRRVKKHMKAGDYSLLIYTILGVVIVLVLLCLLIHGIGGKKKQKATTTEVTTETPTTEEVDPQAVLREQAAYIYQSNPTYLMLVNDTNPITEGYTFEQHLLNSGYIVDERIYSDLLAMLNACNDAGSEYTIKGGYISAETPNSGEYATGLAFDVTAHDVETLEASFVETLPTNKWLMENCSNFGFIIRYPKGKESVTGHSYEPWHFRYVGRDAAVFITNNNLTLEEFYTLLNGGSVDLQPATTTDTFPQATDVQVTDPQAADPQTANPDGTPITTQEAASTQESTPATSENPLSILQ